MSTQQDVVVFDQHTNPVLFPSTAAPVFPPSALVAAIEIKSRLTRAELRATVAKTRLFKRELRAAFTHHPEPPRAEALVCIFAFESGLGLLQTKQTLVAFERDTDLCDRLDMICLLGRGLVLGGSMYANMGRTSPPEPKEQRLAVEFENSLFLFYSRLLDYALERGEVRPQLMSYMDPETPMGVTVGEG
jgi:hypothetical protein